MKNKPFVTVLSGYGLNCEQETLYAFKQAGAEGQIVHLNELIENLRLISKSQIIAVPGGFSFGDDLGSGKAYGRKLDHHLGDALRTFLKRDTLMIGICNGFQILTQANLLPGALTYNTSNQYIDRWVDLEVKSNSSPWLTGITKISLPIAHGEGRYVADTKTFSALKKEDAIAFKYIDGEICKEFNLPANPNGSTENIAGITSHNGRVLGLMPHPERAIDFTHLPHWTRLADHAKRTGQSLKKEGSGLEIFKNAVKYFS